MKKLLLILCLFAGIATVKGQEKDTIKSQNQPDQDRQKIEIGKLPEAVKTALESQDYSGWLIAQAYKSTQTDKVDETKSMDIYVVVLKNGAQTKNVRFDKDGKKIDDERSNDNRK